MFPPVVSPARGVPIRPLAALLATLVALAIIPAAMGQSAPPASRFTQSLSFDQALERVDTSSPRAVLASLIGVTDRWMGLTAERGYSRENWPEINSLTRQLTKIFDLRDVPPDFRMNTAAETATYVRESLARPTQTPRIEGEGSLDPSTL